MRSTVLTAALTAALVGSAHAQEAGQPFFAAFKQFCIETNAAPKAVQAAVLAAGGRPFRPWSGTTQPFPMMAASWTITLSGRELRVSSGVQQAPDPGKPDTLSVSCAVESFQNEDSGLAAARAWVGVPAQQPSDGPMESYRFQQSEGNRTPSPTDDTSYGAASDGGLIWQLTLMRSADGAQAQLLHILGPAPR